MAASLVVVLRKYVIYLCPLAGSYPRVGHWLDKGGVAKGQLKCWLRL